MRVSVIFLLFTCIFLSLKCILYIQGEILLSFMHGYPSVVWKKTMTGCRSNKRKLLGRAFKTRRTNKRFPAQKTNATGEDPLPWAPHLACKQIHQKELKRWGWVQPCLCGAMAAWCGSRSLSNDVIITELWSAKGKLCRTSVVQLRGDSTWRE